MRKQIWRRYVTTQFLASGTCGPNRSPSYRDSKSLSGIPVSPGPASLLSFTFLNKLHNMHLFPHFTEEDSDLGPFR